MRAAWLDPWVHSSVWVAAAAASLCSACALALGVAPRACVALLAACGTFAVYNLDRLRDLPRDRVTSPRRSAFVAAHRRGLAIGALAAAAVAVGLAGALGARVVALLAPVGAAGLLHRRLKRFALGKPVYVAAAWTAVVVGLPALADGPPRHLGWVAAPVFASLLANAIASNLRDGEAVASRWGPRVPLRLARGSALLGLALALLAPAGVRPLALLPAALLLALAGFRAEERYGLLVVDGALIGGSLAALPLF
jgi:hypothetical protein